MAHLLGGIQPVRACRILQRSTPVLVPFLLRGQGGRTQGARAAGHPTAPGEGVPRRGGPGRGVGVRV